MKFSHVICTLFIMLPLGLLAQIKYKVRLGVDFGIVLPKGKTDVVVGTNLKYMVSKKINVGFRIEGAAIAKEIKLDDGSFKAGDSRLNLGYLFTIDYYYLNHKSLYPFISGGIGYYELADISANLTHDYSPIKFAPKVGLMLKTGFEYDKMRMTFGYHFIPKSTIMINGIEQILVNSYVTLSIGYFIGGTR